MNAYEEMDEVTEVIPDDLPLPIEEGTDDSISVEDKDEELEEDDEFDEDDDDDGGDEEEDEPTE